MLHIERAQMGDKLSESIHITLPEHVLRSQKRTNILYTIPNIAFD